MSFVVLIKFISFSIGCLGCFILHSKFNINSTIAASLIGLIGTLLPVPRGVNKQSVYGALYCGTFAGMCSTGVLSSLSQAILLSAIGAVLYVLTINIFKGHGGKLGTVAFVSVALVYLIKSVI